MTRDEAIVRKYDRKYIGCNYCKEMKSTWFFERIDKQDGLWFCNECIQKLKTKKVKQ